MLTGVAPERIVIPEDGVVVDLVDGVARIVGKVQAGLVYVDGLSVGDVSGVVLKDRRRLGEEGFISVYVVVDASTGAVVAGPHVQERGSGFSGAPFDAVVRRIEKGLAKSATRGVADPYVLQQQVRRIVVQWADGTYQRRPMVGHGGLTSVPGA